MSAPRRKPLQADKKRRMKTRNVSPMMLRAATYDTPGRRHARFTYLRRLARLVRQERRDRANETAA